MLQYASMDEITRFMGEFMVAFPNYGDYLMVNKIIMIYSELSSSFVLG
jgi:hypothetical protein